MLVVSKQSIYREDCSYFEGLYFMKLQLTFRGDFWGAKFTQQSLLFSLFYEDGVADTGSDMAESELYIQALFCSGIRATIQEKACVRPLYFNKLIVIPVISE